MSRIIIAPEEWEKFENYVDLIDKEIACFGYCNETEDGDVYVDTLFLVPQEVTGTEVDFIEKGLPFAVKKAIEDERSDDLRFCIHSHVNMGAFFSSTDDGMVKDLGRMGTLPWFASAVFNKKRETYGRIDMFDLPVEFPSIHVEVDVVKGISDELLGQRIEEIEEYVEISKPKPTKSESKKGSGKSSGSKTSPSSSKFDGSDHDLVAYALEHPNVDWNISQGRGEAGETVAFFWDTENDGEYLGEATLETEQEKALLDAEFERDSDLWVAHGGALIPA